MPASSYTFDAKDADAVLQAPLQPGSDQSKDFRVHKVILSIASTFFHDMFSLPQPATRDVALPVIPITESADVFEVFLRLIYPVEPPTITSLQLADDLFQLAEKYMADSVHAKLRQILISSPFLKDDPIWVYALAYRANLDTEAELAIPLTFKIDPIRDIPQAHLRMMTVETYNRLLIAHSTRRAALISAASRARAPSYYPSGCSCGGWFYTRLDSNINLAIWEQPFLDRQRLNSCLPGSTSMESECGTGSCRVSELAISKYLTSILDEIGKLG